MTEANAVKAANAMQVGHDASVKLLSFIGNKKRVDIYRPTLIKAMKECADALDYDFVARPT